MCYTDRATRVLQKRWPRWAEQGSSMALLASCMQAGRRCVQQSPAPLPLLPPCTAVLMHAQKEASGTAAGIAPSQLPHS